MQERRIYKTLRVRLGQQLKLFPAWKIEKIDDLKQNVIERFDLDCQKDDFDLEFFEQEKNQVCQLQNTPNQNRIDPKLMERLINKKIQLKVLIKRKLSENKHTIKQHDQKIVQIPKKIPKDQKHYAQCDYCMQFPIIGIRYKCSICEDFDLCEQCYQELEKRLKDKCHPYIKIRNPIEKIQSIQIAFDDNHLNRMRENCIKPKQLIQKVKDIHAQEIDPKSLPRKDVLARNFVEQLSGLSCSKRQNELSQYNTYRNEVPIFPCFQ